MLIYCLSSVGTIFSAGMACSIDPADEALLIPSPSLEGGATAVPSTQSDRSAQKRVDTIVSATFATAAAFICCICCYKKKKTASSKSGNTTPKAPAGLGLGSSSSSGSSSFSNSMSISGTLIFKYHNLSSKSCNAHT